MACVCLASGQEVMTVEDFARWWDETSEQRECGAIASDCFCDALRREVARRMQLGNFRQLRLAAEQEVLGPTSHWQNSGPLVAVLRPYQEASNEQQVFRAVHDLGWLIELLELPLDPNTETGQGSTPLLHLVAKGGLGVRYSAACFCRRVRFTVSSPPLTSKLCDCKVCQKLHGAPTQWAALFRKPQVRFESSSFNFLRWYHTSTDTVCTNAAERVLPSKLQCSHCGTWVADEGREMFMTFPTLFDFPDEGPERFPAQFLPRCRIFCRSRALAEQ
ncbi:unnamed protein product, partial [Effrenium voratum]